MENLSQFSKYSKKFIKRRILNREYWKNEINANASNFLKILKNFSDLWKILENFWKFHPILKKFGKLKTDLKNLIFFKCGNLKKKESFKEFRTFYRILEKFRLLKKNFRGFQTISEDFGEFFENIKHF